MVATGISASPASSASWTSEVEQRTGNSGCVAVCSDSRIAVCSDSRIAVCRAALAPCPSTGGPASRWNRGPPAVQAQNGCELWRGTFSGNDPSVLVEARLCTDRQGRVTGILQWSSLASGFNEREVAGIRDATGDFELHDLNFRQYHPKFLWKFCLIDRYTLNSDGPDHLVGNYESEACSDNAQIDLSLIAGATVQGK